MHVGSRNTFFLVFIATSLLVGIFYLGKDLPKTQVGTTESSATIDAQESSTPRIVPSKRPLAVKEYGNFRGEVKYSVKQRYYSYGDITVEGSTDTFYANGWYDPETSSFYIDAGLNFSDLKTDDPKRDEEVLKLFTNTEVKIQTMMEEVDELKKGEEILLDIPTLITINNVTRNELFRVTATVSDNKLTAVGKSRISVSDYGIIPPVKLGYFKVDDYIDLSFNITGDAK